MHLPPEEIILGLLLALQRNEDRKLLPSNWKKQSYQTDIDSRASVKVLDAASGWLASF